MSNVLIINGHDYYERAKGKLSNTIFTAIIKQLEHQYLIQTTIVADGYNITEEIQKYKWADVIIIQTPIYWFNISGALKKYLDDIYVPNVFFGKSERFGHGGLFTDKKYMLSVTWGTPEKAFSDPNHFLEGKSEDEVLFNIHKTHEYCGMRPLQTFSVYSAMRDPNVEQILIHLEAHLNSVFRV